MLFLKGCVVIYNTAMYCQERTFFVFLEHLSQPIVFSTIKLISVWLYKFVKQIRVSTSWIFQHKLVSLHLLINLMLSISETELVAKAKEGQGHLLSFNASTKTSNFSTFKERFINDMDERFGLFSSFITNGKSYYYFCDRWPSWINISEYLNLISTTCRYHRILYLPTQICFVCSNLQVLNPSTVSSTGIWIDSSSHEFTFFSQRAF